MENEHFINGNFDTKFIDNYFKPEYLQSKEDQTLEEALGLIASYAFSNKVASSQASNGSSSIESDWYKKRRSMR